MDRHKAVYKQLSVISEKSVDPDVVIDFDTNCNVIETHCEIPELEKLVSKESEDMDNNSVTETMAPVEETKPFSSFKRSRNLSLCEIKEIPARLASRISLPILSTSRTSVTSTESEKFDSLPEGEKDIFNKLDAKDGKSDGKIQKRSLQELIAARFTPNTGNLVLEDKSHLAKRMISQFDEDVDGEIDRNEFAKMMEKLKENDGEKQKSFNEEMLEAIDQSAHSMEFRPWPPPIFMILISLLQLGVFIYHVHHLSSKHQMSIFWTGPAPLCSMWIFDPHKRGQSWRFLTYAIVHSGIGHIIMNIGIQLVVGLPLEMTYDSSQSLGVMGNHSVRVAAVYILGVLAGSLATSCIKPEEYLAGASAGVYALIAAHLANLILNWNEYDLVAIRCGKKMIKANNSCITKYLTLTLILAYIVADIGISVYSYDTYGDQNTIGYIAHFAGAMTGLVSGILILHNIRRESWEKSLRLVCIILLLAFLLTTILWQCLGNKVYQSVHQRNYFQNETEGWGHDACSFYNNKTNMWIETQVSLLPALRNVYQN